MKVGDLVRMKNPRFRLPHKVHIVTWSGQWHVHLNGFHPDQVHSKTDLEVVSERR